MPRADTAETARRWATERPIDLWVLFAGDLEDATLLALEPSLTEIRRDGARIVLVVPPVRDPTDRECELADLLVEGAPAPQPFGAFVALEATAIGDARRLGVIGGSRQALEAGHRAGAGAILGVATDAGTRRRLAPAAPDAIVEPGGLAALYAERWAAGRAHRERVLLNPGPSVVSDRVHRAVAGPDLCHREPEYSALFGRVRQKLLRVADVADDWAVVLIGGSGTAAMEAMTGALVRPGRRLLVGVNGHYGERLATIATRLEIAVSSVEAIHTVPIEPAAVAAALDADSSIDAVSLVHHETTTGLLNPIREIAAVTRQRGVLLAVDAISSFGAEELALADSGIDAVAATSNKCLHGLPGVSFLLMSPRAQGRAREVPPRSLYFDVAGYLAAQDRGTVPFTPAIPATYGLEAALDELLDEGVAERRAHYRERMAFLDRELERLALAPTVAAADRSASVRAVPLPAGIAYEELHDAVKADGYVMYAGLGQAAATTFRICALGNVEIPALEGFMASLERAVNATPARARGVLA